MLHVAAFALAMAAGLFPAATTPLAEQDQACLTCHADPALQLQLPSGETRSLSIDREAFEGSVHGKKLSCVDCHADATEIPHPVRALASRRQFSVAYAEACKRCHFPNFSRTLDGVHAAAVARGDTTAPLCVDCHGSHDVKSPDTPRTRISATCARCHAGVSAAYARSVHGKALGADGNRDVPTCVDCHRSHDVEGPKSAAWENRTPDICARCHADARLMDKYGLSTAVHRTYVADFHGMTASLRASAGAAGGTTPVVARCTDCHGVHDIASVDDPSSPVLRANLTATCRKCHADASENFPAAWLSHYEPSLEHAPLVYAVSIAYKVLIPFMLAGLILQILLHLWRVVVNR